MAAIDKIYGNEKQYEELFYWVTMHDPQYAKNFYQRRTEDAKEIMPICNLPMHGEAFLYQCCPHEWVRNNIEDRCGKEFTKYFENSNWLE